MINSVIGFTILFTIGFIETFLGCADIVFTIFKRRLLMGISTGVGALFACVVILYLTANPDKLYLIIAYITGSIIGDQVGLTISHWLRKRVIYTKKVEALAKAREVKKQKKESDSLEEKTDPSNLC